MITIGGASVLLPAVQSNSHAIGEFTANLPKQGAVSRGGKSLLSFPVLAFSLSSGVASPTSGQGAGKRQHGTIVIRKQVDSASPLLFKALVANEIFKTAKLLITNSGGGTSANYTLKNVVISAVRQSGTGKRPLETLTLVYESIVVQYT